MTRILDAGLHLRRGHRTRPVDRLGHAHLEGRGADWFQRRLARDVTPQVLLATALSHGLVRRPTQLVLGALARLFPGIMATIAARTRVSDAALARTRLDPAS